jgi:predicted DNA-binding transcriptional regulator AlpA
MEQHNLILTAIDKDEFRKWIEQTIVDTIKKIEPPDKQEDVELLTRQEVAQIYKTSLVTLRQWEKDGIIPKPIRKGSRVLFRKSDIMKDINGKTEKNL